MSLGTTRLHPQPQSPCPSGPQAPQVGLHSVDHWTGSRGDPEGTGPQQSLLSGGLGTAWHLAPSGSRRRRGPLALSSDTQLCPKESWGGHLATRTPVPWEQEDVSCISSSCQHTVKMANATPQSCAPPVPGSGTKASSRSHPLLSLLGPQICHLLTVASDLSLSQGFVGASAPGHTAA
jgi:hypothetical protein